MGTNTQYSAQPPTAGVVAHNDMSQLPSPVVAPDSRAPSFSRDPLDPDSNTLCRPVCGLDTSMSPAQSGCAGKQSLPDGFFRGAHSGQFR